MVYNKNERLLFLAVRNLLEYCFDNFEHSFKITSESDLKCYLYRDITTINSKILNHNIQLHGYKDETLRKKIRFPLVITETSYEKEVSATESNERHKCDMVILDKRELEFHLDSKNKPKKWTHYYHPDSVWIELKWSWGKSPSKIKEEIREVFGYLNQKDLARRYVICFDHWGKLNAKDINNITKNRKHKLIYINNLKKEIETYPKSLKHFIIN